MFFFRAEDGIRDRLVTGVQTCALPISPAWVIESPIKAIFCPSLTGRSAPRTAAELIITAAAATATVIRPRVISLTISMLQFLFIVLIVGCWTQDTKFSPLSFNSFVTGNT